MKKFWTLVLLAAAACGTASAQQLTNADFEGDWVNCNPWEKGAYVTKAYGTQPTGWMVSNVPNSLLNPLAAQVEGKEGKGVKLTNNSAVGNSVPAYLELGTPWATAETKGTNTRNKDGGSFGGINFTYKPDAVSFDFKREATKTGDVLTLVAYLWKGTWTQSSVPSNTAVGVFSWGSATKVTMTDRDVNILNKSYELGGAVSKTADAELIASLEQVSSSQAKDWTTMEVPFVYQNASSTPQKMNIIIANTDYFGGQDKVVSGSTLSIDNVNLVYWNTLSSLKYDGAELLEGEETAYDLSTMAYDPAKLVATAKSQFGTASVSYDDATYVATITVTREHAEAKTYTIQFGSAKATATMSVSAAAGWGTFCAPFNVEVPSGVTAYTATGSTDAGVLTLSPVRQLPTTRKFTILANTPVVLKSENGYTNTVEGDAVDGTPVSGLLTGVYVDTPAPRDSYVLQNHDGRVGFYLVDGTTTALPTVGANRCYLTLPAGSNCRALYFDEDIVTALNAAVITDAESTTTFDLQGRRTNAAGQKGMFIVGGKKVIK